MFRLSFIISLILFFSLSVFAQSPHGAALKLDCSVCHNANSWKIELKKTRFDHSTTQFALQGQHSAVDCRSCHKDLVFTNADTECSTCHTDIHQETVGLDCAKCHTPKSWMVEDINGLHQMNRFPLVGQHLLADCGQCHSRFTDLYFEPLDIDCFSCHENNYRSTTSPNHVEAGFSNDCQICHSMYAQEWAGASIIHDFFPLKGGHAIQDCFACHEQGGNFTGLSPECYSCHQQDYESTTDPNHVEANFPTDCNQCHTIIGWSPANFDHNITGFQLTGAHATTPCSSCHTNGFNGTPTDCYSCHQSDYESTTDPNHVSAGFPTDCSQCHNTSSWDDADFDHNQTGFPLTGAHTSLSCSSCHSTGFSGTPTDCYSCHQSDYESTTDPNHVAEGFPTDCSQCHNTSNWGDADFNHNQTNFPLTGAHISLSCSSCHANGYSGTPTDCYSCHQQDYESTTDPNHVSAGFPTNCTQCHSTESWDGADFDHSQTGFTLTGVHLTTSCLSCHQNGFSGTPTDCFSCHSDDYNQSNNPDHQAAGIPTTCEQCHTTSGWIPANFDHSFYPISSRHNDVDCGECHSQANYQPQCLSCHQDDFNEGHNAGDPTDCWDCHSTSNWDSNFNHGATNFPLTGAHVGLSCQLCHQNGYQGTPTECVACHQTDYNNSSNPSHQTLALSTECSTCHSTEPNWQPATFPIHDQFYQLLGAHLEHKNDCTSCHNGNYNNTPNQCNDCHQSDYQQAVNPNHTAAGISTDCEPCHNSVGWSPSIFDHASTGFALSGQHATIQCSSCHEGTTGGLSADCFGCHEANYNSAPNHLAQNFPTSCDMCHNANAWSEVSFDHSNTNFPLTGAHLNVNCSECHSAGYTGTTTVCYGCHQSNYEQAINPNHTTAGISTDCEPCHNTVGWSPSIFDHASTGFALSGQHATTQCSSCHEGTTSGLSPECFGCHEANYNSAPNHLAQNFPTNCELCHNANAWSEVTFDHSNTNFPLTGAHLNLDCTECHSSGYTGTTTLCYDCHQTAYNQSVNPDHTALALPTDCADCHTTEPNWQPATFPIHNQFYELIGAHANISNQCNNCHFGNYNNTIPNTCFGCHETDYNGANDPPHQTLNFSHECIDCHSQNDWSPANFDHNFYPISSHHNNVDCNDCHSEANYQPQCMSCHTDDFFDGHNSGHSTDCWDCHSTNNWNTGPNKFKLKRMD